MLFNITQTLSMKLTIAPCSINILAISKRPVIQAMVRGVMPMLSTSYRISKRHSERKITAYIGATSYVRL